MSTASLLPFLRGVDFSRVDFNKVDVPKNIEDMSGLHWFKANNSNLNEIPNELKKLDKIETLTLVNNRIKRIPEWITNKNNMRSLILKNNELATESFTANMFLLNDLTTLDLSYNSICKIPLDMVDAKNLQVLNLCYNKITKITNHFFLSLNDLMYLDLSGNQLESLPPQLRRLTNLQVLIINDNPMENFAFRQLPSLVGLQRLCMRNTGRNINNIPANLENLSNLQELDFSHNDLTWIPESLFKLKNLKRLNLSSNAITLVPSKIENMQNLEVLNLCCNALKSLPSLICKLEKLRRLYLDDNSLESEGLPAGIGKLQNLEVLSLADNKLRNIPDSICQCVKLKGLILKNNNLKSLPSDIYLALKNLKNLDLENNPGIILPAKKRENSMGQDQEYYNFNFSLQYHLERAGLDAPPQSASTIPNHGHESLPILSLKKTPSASNIAPARHKNVVEGEAERLVLQGMNDNAKNKRNTTCEELFKREQEHKDSISVISYKNVSEIEKSNNIDYSDFFEPSVGTYPGIICWEIENFLPNRLEDALVGKFYDGDCYIVLQTYYPNPDIPSLSWKIFYWIGKDAPLDKQACAAMHAVNLRNFLRASQCRTSREEQGEESVEFMKVFDYNVSYIQGGRTTTGFYAVTEKEHQIRLYRCTSTQNKIRLEPVGLNANCLDPRFVYLLDAPKAFYIWQGSSCKSVLASKTRLLAEKINNVERKKDSLLVQFKQGKEPSSFWEFLNNDEESAANREIKARTPPSEEDCETQDSSWNDVAVLYKVSLGTGYLELYQVRIPCKGKNMGRDLLESKCVYILDTFKDLYVWVGKKANRLIRTAAFKLSKELYHMISRPEYSVVNQMTEGTESQIFKCYFTGWDDVLAVDHTKSTKALNKKENVEKKETLGDHNKMDISALFKPRQPPFDAQQASSLVQGWNEDLEVMECFVLEGKKYVKLPTNEIGQFYSGACYAFICRYWIATEISNPALLAITEAKAQQQSACTTDKVDGESDAVVEGEEQDENEQLWEEKFQPVVYFWQGRDASPIGWLTFSFGLGKKFEDTFGKENLQVIKVLQQQESPKFLSHFKRQFVIHSGLRAKKGDDKTTNLVTSFEETTENAKELATTSSCRLYHLRTNNHTLFYTRCIEIKCDCALLNSSFCYILKIPNTNADGSDESGLCYVWIGQKSEPEEAELAEEIAYKICLDYNVIVLDEGSEPEEFWQAMNGRKEYEKDAEYVNYLRLFRCSNDMGYFRITERCADFCQDDLCNDDIMLLDNGLQIFIWVGSQSSEMEMKLAYKSAKVYIDHLQIIQPERPRKLMLTIRGKESIKFTKCFHGWSHYRNLA